MQLDLTEDDFNQLKCFLWDYARIISLYNNVAEYKAILAIIMKLDSSEEVWKW